MISRKKIFAYSGIIVFSLATLGSILLTDGSINRIFADQHCYHKNVEHYDGVAPTLDNAGIMEHYACCQCHTAWADAEHQNEIGNTLTDRTKINIFAKTDYSVIAKSEISDDIKYINENSPYVIGLDQTNWSSHPDGKGSGSFNFVNIDNRQAVRISTENITNEQRTTLDASYSGYSSWTFSKKINGKMYISFDYKYYDLDRSSYESEARTHVVFAGKETIGYEIALTGDNAWHTCTINVDKNIELDNFSFKIHHFSGEMFISNMVIVATSLDAPVIEKTQKAISFNPVENADYYLIHDNNDNRNEIRLTSSDIASDGKLHYKPFVVGEHEIYVTAHNTLNKYLPSTSNVIDDIYVDPVFIYGQFTNEYYVPKTYNGDTSDLPNDYKTIFDDWGLYHARQTYDGALVGEDNGRGFTDRLDLTKGENLEQILNYAVELGNNVLSLNDFGDGCLRYKREGETWNYFVNSNLKHIMDEAWKRGLKVIVYDQEIHHTAFDEKNETLSKQVVFNRLLDENYSLPMIQHPAFYGFTVIDEPSIDDVDHVANVAHHIQDFFNEYYVSKNLSTKDPFILCSLLPYTRYFSSQNAYKAYLRTWLDNSGKNYLMFDEYTYRASKYDTGRSGTDELLDLQYTILSEVLTEPAYKSIRIHQVATSNNDKDLRSPFNIYDVFGSTLFAAAYNNLGISRFSYFPAAFTYHWNNGIVNRDGSKKESFDWVAQAQQSFNLVNSLLDGFKVTKVSYDTWGNYGYINTRRTAKLTLSNGISTYLAYINYDSNPSSYLANSYKVNIPNNRVYYSLGPGKTLAPHIGTDNSVTVGLGSMVLLMDETESNRDIVFNPTQISGSFGQRGSSDLSGFDYSVADGLLHLVTTDTSNPLAWLNRNCNGATSFKDVARRSSSFTIKCKAPAGTLYNFQLIDKLTGRDPEYMGYSGDINVATGGWDNVTFTGYSPNADDFALYFFQGNGVRGATLDIQSITFHGINGPLFLIEDLEYFDHVTLSDGFGTTQIVSTYSNPDYENTRSFTPTQNNTTRSYSFDFKLNLSNTNNSIFFFMEGNTGWSGIEFVILTGGLVQIYLPASGSAVNSIEYLQPDITYNVSFGIIRAMTSNNLYAYVTVNGTHWVQWVIEDSSAYSTSHIGFYNYASISNDTVMTISNI